MLKFSLVLADIYGLIKADTRLILDLKCETYVTKVNFTYTKHLQTVCINIDLDMLSQIFVE